MDKECTSRDDRADAVEEFVLGRLVASGRGGVQVWRGSLGRDVLRDGTAVEGMSFDERLRELIGAHGAEDFRVEAPYRLRELAQWMSEIESVDGATEVTPEFEIAVYGAKIATSGDYKERVEDVASAGTRKWLNERGTRRSAAYWVASHCGDGTLASGPDCPRGLIVSADGDANAIFWHGSRVCRRPVVYRRL